MRITFVVPNDDLGGGSRVIASHAAALGAMGHEVTLATLKQPVSLRARIVQRLRGELEPGPVIGHLSRVQARRLHVTPRDARHALPDADVVIATWWQTAQTVAGLPRSKGAKAYFLQGYEVRAHPAHAEALAATWRLPLNKLVVSPWLASIAAERFGDESALLVPNGVDTDLFRAPPRGRQARPTAGFVYSQVAIKGPDVAVATLEQMRKALPDLRALSFGSSRPIAEFPLPGWVEFHLAPPQEQLPVLYASADVWLWPSREEGFGLPILEAMACRTPVVAARAGAAQMLLDEGGGTTVPPGDPKAMAEAAVDVCRLSPQHWQTRSEAAFASAQSRNAGAASERFERALHAVIERSDPSGHG